MNEVQAEHAEWLRELYPGQVPEFPAAGMVEEAGELMHVLLKCQQANGGQHPEERYRGADWDAKLIDAVGDCGLYLCSLCNTVGWSFGALVHEAKFYPSESRTAFHAAAKLVEESARVCFDPTGRPHALWYMVQLLAICSMWGVDFEGAVRRTWAEVKERRRACA